ncbi:hypothetical protein [Numidum massiliense]|uniref:hypothetical protein n=1 Tax=Numidum massiliense TaxID=1522315 RepID=UPI0006D542AF|nr:hypothetical protein [Numidum massiliense]
MRMIGVDLFIYKEDRRYDCLKDYMDDIAIRMTSVTVQTTVSNLNVAKYTTEPRRGRRYGSFFALNVS